MKTSKTQWAMLAVAGLLASITTVSSIPSAQGPCILQEEKKDTALDGKVEAVNTFERTFDVSGKTVYTTLATTFTKGSKNIVLSDIKVGDEVHAMTHDTSDGKVEASSVEVITKK